MSEERFDPKKSAEKVNRYHRAARNSAGQSVVYAIQCGAEINRAKQALPHGEFLPWLQDVVKIPSTSADRYRALADQLLPRLLKFPTVGNLVELAAGDLTEAQSLKLSEAVNKITGRKALTQLYIDFGIVKSGAEAGPKGGDNEWAAWIRKHHPELMKDGVAPKRKPGIVGEEVWAEWEAHCLKRGKLTPEEMRARAEADAQHLLHVMTLALGNDGLALASLATRDALKQIVSELHKRFKDL